MLFSKAENINLRDLTNKYMSDEPKGGDPTLEVEKAEFHEYRKRIDACIKRAEEMQVPGLVYGRELSLVRTKLQEAKMWGGKCLEVLGSELPQEFRNKAE